MPNTALNRTVALLLTNRSGGALTYGAVVIIDTANASAFTTTTTAGYSATGVGVVIEPNGIASLALGMVAVGGYVPIINLNTAATIGQLIRTHTVAGQGTPHASPQTEGDFAEALTASATPEAFLFCFPNGPSAAGSGITQLTSDVTAGPGSGSQAATIAANAVTFAKMQDITTDRLLGRDTAASGDPEEISLSTGLEFSGSASIRLTTGIRTHALTFVFDGGGAVIPTNKKARLYIPYNCTIIAATIILDQSGSIVIDVWKDILANYPPTVADTITAAAKPTVSGAVQSQDNTLAGWTTAVSAGDTMIGNVDSVATATLAVLTLTVVKT